MDGEGIAATCFTLLSFYPIVLVGCWYRRHPGNNKNCGPGYGPKVLRLILHAIYIVFLITMSVFGLLSTGCIETYDNNYCENAHVFSRLSGVMGIVANIFGVMIMNVY